MVIISDLSIQADKLVEQGIAESTKSTYTAPQKQFYKFCMETGLNPLPASTNTVLLFLTHLHNKGLSYNTCHVYLSAVKSMHILHDVVPPNLSNARIRLALKAIKKKCPEPQCKKPITFNILQKIWSLLKGAKNEKCIKAILALSFFGGLRGSEYLSTIHKKGPKLKNVWFTKNKSLTMHYSVTRSKTKTHGFVVPYKCSGHEVCAVCAMEAYLAEKQQLTPLSENSNLFEIQGKQVTKAMFNSILKKILHSMGANTQGYSLHSIRYGAATTAAQNKFADWEIKLIGGWSTNTYRTYINTKHTSHRARFSRRLTQ